MNHKVQREKECELIAAIVAGDTQLYHQLIRPYERTIYIVSRCWMENDDEAEYVAQQAFIKAFQNLGAFPGNSSFRAWLLGIAINEARNRSSRQLDTRISFCDSSLGEDLPISPALMRDWRQLSSHMLECEEIKSLLRHAIWMLQGNHRKVFLLRELGELSCDDTAHILNIHTSEVKAILHRARTILQSFLAPKLAARNNPPSQIRLPQE